MNEEQPDLPESQPEKRLRNDGQPWGRTGPSGEPRWAEKTVRGIQVGRNRVVIPPEEVEHLASLGCSDREISDYYDVHENTLRYNFKEYLVKGRHRLKLTIRQAQIRTALEGNATLLIWLGKNLLGQNDAGTASDDRRPLPWTDDIDDSVDDSAEEIIAEDSVEGSTQDA